MFQLFGQCDLWRLPSPICLKFKVFFHEITLVQRCERRQGLESARSTGYAASFPCCLPASLALVSNGLNQIWLMTVTQCDAVQSDCTWRWWFDHWSTDKYCPFHSSLASVWTVFNQTKQRKLFIIEKGTNKQAKGCVDSVLLFQFFYSLQKPLWLMRVRLIRLCNNVLLYKHDI